MYFPQYFFKMLKAVNVLVILDFVHHISRYLKAKKDSTSQRIREPK